METAPCKKCEREIPATAERCPECGYEPYEWLKKAKLTPKQKPCAKCEGAVPVDSTECPSCGYQRNILFRWTGTFLLLIGILSILTVVGIPVGAIMAALGGHIRTAGSFWANPAAAEATAAKV